MWNMFTLHKDMEELQDRVEILEAKVDDMQKKEVLLKTINELIVAQLNSEEFIQEIIDHINNLQLKK